MGVGSSSWGVDLEDIHFHDLCVGTFQGLLFLKKYTVGVTKCLLMAQVAEDIAHVSFMVLCVRRLAASET